MQGHGDLPGGPRTPDPGPLPDPTGTATSLYINRTALVDNGARKTEFRSGGQQRKAQLQLGDGPAGVGWSGLESLIPTSVGD